jgi:hypothetical protein
LHAKAISTFAQINHLLIGKEIIEKYKGDKWSIQAIFLFFFHDSFE